MDNGWHEKASNVPGLVKISLQKNEGESSRLLEWIKRKYFQWDVQKRNFKNICWLGSHGNVKCRCSLDSSIGSSEAGWNVLIFDGKSKKNILTFSRNAFSIFYWIENSRSFHSLETFGLNLKTLKCWKRCYIVLLSQKAKTTFQDFFFYQL